MPILCTDTTIYVVLKHLVIALPPVFLGGRIGSRRGLRLVSL